MPSLFARMARRPALLRRAVSLYPPYLGAGIRAADGSKVLHWCETDIVDTGGEVVARVRKQLYVRRKRKD